MDIENVRAAARKLRESLDMLGRGPLDFYLSELVAAHDLLMQRYAPIKKGQRVKLARTPTVNDDVRPGWAGFRHLLVEGALADVVDAGCGSRGFWFDVTFVNEHWYHPITGERVDTPPGKRHSFRFGEGELDLA